MLDSSTLAMFMLFGLDLQPTYNKLHSAFIIFLMNEFDKLEQETQSIISFALGIMKGVEVDK